MCVVPVMTVLFFYKMAANKMYFKHTKMCVHTRDGCEEKALPHVLINKETSTILWKATTNYEGREHNFN